MKVVVIGGTGLIGAKVVATLAEHGHEAVAASPRSGVNTISGEGLDELIRKGLSFREDPRAVVADPEARYYDALLTERVLLPGADARKLDHRFEDWLVQTAPTTQA
jgi:nucleoside-diphosphate-sugar epimerase